MVQETTGPREESPSKRQRSGKGKDKGKGKGNRDITRLLAQLTLRAATDMRAVNSFLYKVALLPADALMVVDARQEAMAYGQQTKQKGNNHGLGPPHVHVRCACMRAVVKAAKDGGREAKVVEKVLAELMTPLEADRFCSYFRVSKAHMEDKANIQMRLNVDCTVAAETEKECKAEVEAAGGDVKEGQAPATNLERQVRVWLDGGTIDA